MRDFLRTLFNVRTKRRMPATSVRPVVGAFIIHSDFRINVSQSISQDLWDWMVLCGWRTVPVRIDRRSYKEVPNEILVDLINAPSFERSIVHAKIFQ